MQNEANDPKPFDAGWHLSYMLYGATGEGLTLRLLVAGSAEAAERELKKRLDPYFHVGVVTVPMGAGRDDEVQSVLEWIPPPVTKYLHGSRLGAGYYYGEYHCNDS